MSYYQKFRPHQFTDVLGQEQIIAILKSQTKTRHFHHAYLLFGASGSGKTTTARLLAMALNCPSLNGNGEPCGKCQSCEAVIEGRHWDILEIDGARFRGIDDIRELAYRAYLSPFGNKKVYIIDECHALSDAAWQGMLKLLEEPPPHLVILLCTLRRYPILSPAGVCCYPSLHSKHQRLKQSCPISVRQSVSQLTQSI